VRKLLLCHYLEVFPPNHFKVLAFPLWPSSILTWFFCIKTGVYFLACTCGYAAFPAPFIETHFCPTCILASCPVSDSCCDSFCFGFRILFYWYVEDFEPILCYLSCYYDCAVYFEIRCCDTSSITFCSGLLCMFRFLFCFHMNFKIVFSSCRN
jgi:hypothetical protein